MIRSFVGSVVVLVTISLFACGPARPKQDGGTGGGLGTGGGGSCVGNCGGGTGTGGGNAMGGGTGTGGGGTTTTDGGIRDVSVAQARQATFCTDNMKLTGVVVTAVDDVFQGAQGDFSVQFWVADPSNPGNGIYIDKFFTDEPKTYEPHIGDVLNIEGYLQRNSKYDDWVAYRTVFKSQFGCGLGATGKLVITKTGTMAPLTDHTAPGNFGTHSDGGTLKANRDLAGSRVSIPGPLTLTDATPARMKRLGGTNTVYFGFEVSGGILVSNYKTYDRYFSDGGSQLRCDWGAVVRDGGSVTFPNGIKGVWDTFSHAPCYDGSSSSSCRRDAGFVPSTTTDFTYALHPQDCANDLVGQ